ncbi:hypothetical protein Rhow_008419 [Rhodococcus wratislaviensis]|uniref:Uncharacterized protein n=1 Tax=Rhodococcus wratislaviensis TaxID=44752 RepID=A0A402CKG9_RHOWR|nr:hypothetical protein [Rhodococcus wratislaviensis]GCE44121.1 hypothetical protein Rhow_008419 [Rhodococcus wratislaviensis]
MTRPQTRVAQFCEIVASADSSVREVYREPCCGHLPLAPPTLGGALVIPRNHLPDIWALDDETAWRIVSVLSG